MGGGTNAVAQGKIFCLSGFFGYLSHSELFLGLLPTFSVGASLTSPRKGDGENGENRRIFSTPESLFCFFFLSGLGQNT